MYEDAYAFCCAGDTVGIQGEQCQPKSLTFSANLYAATVSVFFHIRYYSPGTCTSLFILTLKCSHRKPTLPYLLLLVPHLLRQDWTRWQLALQLRHLLERDPLARRPRQDHLSHQRLLALMSLQLLMLRMVQFVVLVAIRVWLSPQSLDVFQQCSMRCSDSTIARRLECPVLIECVEMKSHVVCQPRSTNIYS